jgi:hypothetical protein
MANNLGTAQATIIAIVIITFIIKWLIRRAAAVGAARRPSLQRLYKDLNRDYFDNSLPLYRVR